VPLYFTLLASYSSASLSDAILARPDMGRNNLEKPLMLHWSPSLARLRG